MAQPRTITVWGNYGELDIHRETGEVLSYQPADDTTPDYADIVRFDVAEYQAWLASTTVTTATWDQIESIDVVDIGFWSKDGSYEPPVAEHRDELPSRFGAEAPLPF